MLVMALGAAAALWPRSPDAVPALTDFDRYVYVASRGAPEVTVIDGKTDRIVTTVHLDAIPGQIVVSKATASLVASDPAHKTLTMIDLEHLEVRTVINLDIVPDHMQMSPDGYLVAVGDVSRGSVAIVSLYQRRQLSLIDGLSKPYNLTFGAGGSMIYVANRGAGHISVIDVSQGKVINEIPISTASSSRRGADGRNVPERGVTNVTGTPNGRFAFATTDDDDVLAVVDLDRNAVAKTLPLGKRPWRAYATADGRFMMVPNNGDKTVSVVSTTSLETVATVSGVADAVAVNTGWFDSVAFVISRGENKAIVIDLINMKLAGGIALPGSPGPGVVTPDGKKLYVALSGSNKMAVIDMRYRRLATVIDNVGTQPWGATMGHSNNYCH
jgi:YVTN family beta-propeller protein